MTFDEFIKKWLGQKCDYDGWYDGQCVDLYRQYVAEVLGFTQSPGVGGAAEIWDSADPDYYDFIEKTSTTIPEKGDIVIWNRNAGGGFGHVGIFVEGNENEFTSFDQNWPTLDECTLTKHDYKNVIGWLSPKSTNKDEYIKKLEEEIERRKKLQIENDGRIEDCRTNRDSFRTEVERLKGELKAQQEDFQRDKVALERRNKEEKTRYNTILDKLALLLDSTRNEPEIFEAVETAVSYEDKVEKLDRELKDTKKSLSRCKSDVALHLEQAQSLVGIPFTTLEGVLSELRVSFSRENDSKEVKNVAKTKSLAERWGELPKEIKVLPYLMLSAALTALVQGLTEIKADSIIVMGLINLVIVFLNEMRKRFLK